MSSPPPPGDGAAESRQRGASTSTAGTLANSPGRSEWPTVLHRTYSVVTTVFLDRFARLIADPVRPE